MHYIDRALEKLQGIVDRHHCGNAMKKHWQQYLRMCRCIDLAQDVFPTCFVHLVICDLTNQKWGA